MGREENLEILLKYVEEALKINAIDHYWMIDMTRNMDDHEYIHRHQQRMNALYKNRVHMVNRDIRRKEIISGTAKDTIGQWAPFYKFCNRFKNDDVIIKCDDDTLYIDVEAIEAAAQLRWDNKAPFLMHANTINNGITAYHQAKAGIWKNVDSVINEYPTAGLTGPLFSHPEVACDCHDQFCKDLISDENNINKYKLGKNIYFTARVSINTILMLGKDKKLFTDINTQDEFITSCKIGQRTDRPNMIIGDFVTAHHTYGVQEPVMEARNTLQGYERLRDSIFSKDIERTNKPITSTFNKISTIRHGNTYIMKMGATENSYTIKNKMTDKYITVDWEVIERMKRDSNGQPTGTGVFYAKSELNGDPARGVLLNITPNTESIIQIQEGPEIIITSKEGVRDPRFFTFPIKMWFQQNYKKQLCNFIKQSDGTYKIQSKLNPEYYFAAAEFDRPRKMVKYFFELESSPTHVDDNNVWILESYNHMKNDLIVGDIKRSNIDVDNDVTYADPVNKNLPINKLWREYYWPVKDYIWEFEEIQKNEYKIKLIADDKEPLYLTDSPTGVSLKQGTGPVWKLMGNVLQSKGGLFLSVENGEVNLSKKKCKFKIKPV